MSIKKADPYNLWRQNHRNFYNFVYESYLDWPSTSIQWGPLINSNSQVINQRIYFSCKTDGTYNSIDGTWINNPNYIVLANVQIPQNDYYLIPELKSIFNYDAAKKHPNIKVKQIISHPGEITVIRTSHINRKLLVSKSDTNNVYVWTNQKYKPPQSNITNQLNMTNTPDIILQTTTSIHHNYALRFTPSLPRIISASQNKLQLFDLQGSSCKQRQTTNINSSYNINNINNNNTSIIKPLLTLEGHNGVEDVTFKNNQICISAGQDKEIGVWDLRIGEMVKKINNIHQNDINAISVKNNYILSGGQQGRVNIIDDRMYKLLYKFENNIPIHSIQFNPSTNHFAIGKQYLSFYNLDNILQTQKFQQLFTHYGLRGNIHQFDWNTQSPFTIAQTYQDPQPEGTSSQGGVIHIYSPLDLFFMKKQKAIDSIEIAFNKLTEEEKIKLLKAI